MLEKINSIMAAACHRRAQMLQPSSNPAALSVGKWSAPDDAEQEETFILLELARHVCVDYLVGKLVEPHVLGVRRLVVECQAAKAEK